MAFNPNLLTRVQIGNSSFGQQIAEVISSSLTVTTLPTQMWTYNAANDTAATVEAAGYFVYFADWLQTLAYNNGIFLRKGDLIYCVCSDANVWLQVTATGATITTQVAPASANSVATAAIQANAVGSGQLALNTLQYVKVPITAAQWNGMYAAPLVLIAAPGAGNLIVVEQAALVMTFVSAQYAAGGAVALQYDSTVHGAGTAASATIAAATVNGYAASSNIAVAGALASSGTATTVNKALYISNATGAFTTGDSTFNAHIWYRVVVA